MRNVRAFLAGSLIAATTVFAAACGSDFSTQPTQALSFLNGEFMNLQAKIFADRLKKEAGNDVNSQVRLGLYLATSRQPSDADIRRGAGLIQTLQTEDRVSADAALQSFCLVVLNLNEFMYLD